MKKLFGSDDVRRALFDYAQEFDFQGLKGRLESTSYCPLPGTEKYDIIIRKLRELFHKHTVEKKVRFTYKTEVYIIRCHESE
jgi:hypothetical protein